MCFYFVYLPVRGHFHRTKFTNFPLIDYSSIGIYSGVLVNAECLCNQLSII